MKRSSVESLVWAGARTDRLHDVPKIILACSGSSADVGVLERDVVARGVFAWSSSVFWH